MFACQSKRRRRSRWEIDYAIHWHLAALGSHRAAQAALERLVPHVRSVSSLLRPDAESGRPGWIDAARFVQGLAALSRECRYWRSLPEAWKPGVDSRLGQFGSLASHLFGGHSMPMFMVFAWFAESSPEVIQQRMWFRHLAAGHSLRGLGLPIEITKAMTRFFYEAPSHLPIEKALDWAALRAEGMERQAALDHVDLGRNSRQRRPLRIGTTWRGLGIRGFQHTEAYASEWHVRTWQVRELLDDHELESEARTLHHCVHAYTATCRRGRASIWSLRCTDHRGRDRRELTIEIDPRTRTIVQARGKWDKKPTPAARRIMLAWARQEGLHIAIGV